MPVDLDARLAPIHCQPGLPVYAYHGTRGWQAGQVVGSGGGGGVVVELKDGATGAADGGGGERIQVDANGLYPYDNGVEESVPGDLTTLREPHEAALQRRVCARAAGGRGSTGVGASLVIATDPQTSADTAVQGPAGSELYRLAKDAVDAQLRAPEDRTLAVVGATARERRCVTRAVVRHALHAAFERGAERSGGLPSTDKAMEATLSAVETVIDTFAGVRLKEAPSSQVLPRSSGATKVWFRYSPNDAARLARASRSRNAGDCFPAATTVEGVEVASYLMDTHRVLLGYPGVRGYEAFYQLFYGPKSGKYTPLALPDAVEQELWPDTSDAARGGHEKTQAALKALGLGKDMIDAVWRAVGALGYLHQVDFEPDAPVASADTSTLGLGRRTPYSVSKTTEGYAKQAATLMGLDVGMLSGMLCRTPAHGDVDVACYTTPSAPVHLDAQPPHGAQGGAEYAAGALDAGAGVDPERFALGYTPAEKDEGEGSGDGGHNTPPAQAAADGTAAWLRLRRNALIAHVYARLYATIMDAANAKLAPGLRGAASGDLPDVTSQLHAVTILDLHSPADAPSLCGVERWCATTAAEIVRDLFRRTHVAQHVPKFETDGVAPTASEARYQRDALTHASLPALLATSLDYRPAHGTPRPRCDASITSTIADVAHSGTLTTVEFLAMLANRFSGHDAFRKEGPPGADGFAVHTSSGWLAQDVTGWIGRAATGCAGGESSTSSAAIADLMHLIATGRPPSASDDDYSSFEFMADDAARGVQKLRLAHERTLAETGWAVGCRDAHSVVDGFSTWLRGVLRALGCATPSGPGVQHVSWVLCARGHTDPRGITAQLRAYSIPLSIEVQSYAHKSYTHFASRYAPIEGFDARGRRGGGGALKSGTTDPAIATKQLINLVAAEDPTAFTAPAVVMGRGHVFLRRKATDALEARLKRARVYHLEALVTVLQTFARVKLSEQVAGCKKWARAAVTIQGELRDWLGRTEDQRALARRWRDETRFHYTKLLNDVIHVETSDRRDIENEAVIESLELRTQMYNVGRQIAMHESRAQELYDQAARQKEVIYAQHQRQSALWMQDTFHKSLLLTCITAEETARRHISHTLRDGEWVELLLKFDYVLCCARIGTFFTDEKSDRQLLARLEIMQRAEMKQRLALFEVFECSLRDAVDPWLDCLDAVKYWARHIGRRKTRLQDKRSMLKELAEYETHARQAPTTRDYNHRDGPNRVEMGDAWKGCTGVPDADHLKMTQDRAVQAKVSKASGVSTPGRAGGGGAGGNQAASPRRFASPGRAQMFTDVVTIPTPPARYTSATPGGAGSAHRRTTTPQRTPRTTTPVRGRPSGASGGPSTPRAGGGPARTHTPTTTGGRGGNGYTSVATPGAPRDTTGHLSPPRDVHVTRVLAKSPVLADHAVHLQTRKEAAGATARLGDIGGYTAAQFLTARQSYLEKFAQLKVAGFYPPDGPFLHESSIVNIRTLRLAQEKLHDTRVGACVQLCKQITSRNQFIRRQGVLEELAVGGKWRDAREGNSALLDFHTDPALWERIRDEVERLGAVIAHHKEAMRRILQTSAKSERSSVRIADLNDTSPYLDVQRVYLNWAALRARAYPQLAHATAAETFTFFHRQFLGTTAAATPLTAVSPAHTTPAQHMRAVSPLRHRRTGLPP